jgi:hypothetical protein
MSVYDEYGSRRVQLKVGPCRMGHYDVGDRVKERIRDGGYVGWEGVVVIKGRVVVGVFKDVFTKWGDVIDKSAILTLKNPANSDT